MIVMDLEWNRSYDKKRLDEILQIGAVRVERPGGRVADTFCAFVRPCVHKRFDPGARKLPDLQESLNTDTTFVEAWDAFVRWCGDDRTFAFWGPDDFGVMRQNCAYWGTPCIEPERVYNFQRAFAHAYGAGSAMMALWRVVDYLGIPDIFDFHNALYDALYTALVGEWLRTEDLDYAPPKRVKRQPPRRKRKTPASAGATDGAQTPQTVSGSGAPDKKRRRRRRRRRRLPKPDITQTNNTASV